ncbi:VWA domain-containing protein [uncultured Lamprocystis sp.]|jgi:cobalamin biosynthesis protein CobT|uniref:VWA domain-containing protein n=1 Tax=uncultured Lamprocystis sp. TaxID=543132 RepID=UPI0025D4CD96|nr:VWA domain-containing protein [uncultured Lamprocystis sp.]
MNQNNLMQALPIVAAAYGRKFGVQVVVGGNRACTNGHRILIPAISDDPNAKMLAWGYLTHEAAHLRFTDFQAGEGTRAKGPVAKAILGVVEDIRIENAMMHPYPGARITLDALWQWLLAAGMTAPPKDGDRSAAVLVNTLIVMGRHRYRNMPAFAAAANEAERVLRNRFPARFVHQLFGLMAEIPSLRSTAGAAELTERMVALIEADAQEPPPPKPGDDEAAGDQAPGDDEATGDQAPGDDEAAGDQAPGDDEAAGDQAPGDDAATGGQAPGDDAATGDQTPGDDEAAGRDALRAILSAGQGDLPQDLFEEVAQKLNGHTAGRCTPLLPSLEDYQGNQVRGNARLAAVKGESAKLAARLQGLVQAHDLVRTRTVRRGHTVSTRHLHRAAVGDDRIFQRKDTRAAPNTAIHLVLDLSESMERGPDRLALDAAMALALALEPMRGVSCAATAFPGRDKDPSVVTRIKSHGDRVAARAGAFMQEARGGTPMSGALWYAAADLLARPEERKVILTLTDGDPNDWDSAAGMVTRATAAGIEMIGVGIGTSVDRLFPVAVQIASVADLKGELFRIAEQLLLK